jgi:glutamate-1-semialdehyde 2,1-aminomutase
MAKQPSLAGHPRLARLIARLLPRYDLDDRSFFGADDAPEDIVRRRRAGFAWLGARFRGCYAEARRLGAEALVALSDQQFTSRYRVPFPFSRFAREQLEIGAFAVSTSGVTITDTDGNTSFDLSGSYGVNLFGYDFYKACIRVGAERVGSLGPVLGPYHPVVVDNVRRLREISGLDEVSFHMSGTEAVMQAVQLARYHTRRSHLVRFCGAYHGWWGDVQPGVGNPSPARDTYTLQDLSERSLRVLRSRRDIACILVNPLQCLHPNAGGPTDSALVDSSRSARPDREAYARWLQALRAICSERGIVLILDEVLTGFRLAPGGAQEYFGLQADMVVYGKTIGGGLPVGLLCGRRELMRRFRDEHPADICFARGTFNTHPYVMGAMHEFLRRFDSAEIRRRYDNLDEVWDRRAELLNARLREAALPVHVANLSSIWTVCYDRPSRYNWILQYYLRAEGISLSWIGTGRLLFSLDYAEADFEAVADRFVAAARTMESDGWWAGNLATNASIRRRLLWELAAHWLRGRARSLPRLAQPATSGRSARRAEDAAAPGGRA